MKFREGWTPEKVARVERIQAVAKRARAAIVAHMQREILSKHGISVPLHAIVTELPPDYFCPPSAGNNHVNEVTAFYPRLSFRGKFARKNKGELWHLITQS